MASKVASVVWLGAAVPVAGLVGKKMRTVTEGAQCLAPANFMESFPVYSPRPDVALPLDWFPGDFSCLPKKNRCLAPVASAYVESVDKIWAMCRARILFERDRP